MIEPACVTPILVTATILNWCLSRITEAGPPNKTQNSVV